MVLVIVLIVRKKHLRYALQGLVVALKNPNKQLTMTEIKSFVNKLDAFIFVVDSRTTIGSSSSPTSPSGTTTSAAIAGVDNQHGGPSTSEKINDTTKL